jgi:uncharacterized protein YxjI
MAIQVKCRCGRTYNLKEEFAGKVVQCPHCANQIAVPAPERAAAIAQADPAFDRDVFLLRQKHLTIGEKYVVADEQGQPLLFVERPARLARRWLAWLCGIVAALAAGAVLFAVYAGPVVAVIFWAGRGIDERTAAIWTAIGVILMIVTLVAVLIAMYPKRHVTFYRDQSKRNRLLEVVQDKKNELIVATFTVIDPAGQVLARFRKNYLHNFFRKRWDCYGPDGATLCVAKEDSAILSLLRRFIGPLLGILRTNFLILAGETDRVIGEFNRKFTILDRYVLDLKADPRRTLDRRIAIALGVMLDTGERR